MVYQYIDFWAKYGSDKFRNPDGSLRISYILKKVLHEEVNDNDYGGLRRGFGTRIKTQGRGRPGLIQEFRFTTSDPDCRYEVWSYDAEGNYKKINFSDAWGEIAQGRAIAIAYWPP